MKSLDLSLQVSPLHEERGQALVLLELLLHLLHLHPHRCQPEVEEQRQKGKVEDEKDVEDDLADPSEIVRHKLVPVEKAVDASRH